MSLCIDYRKMNSITKKDQYPLSCIKDILDTLGEMRNFSTLDLVSGYWQIETGKEARQKSCLVTHCSLHEFVHMPFGLYNVRHVPALDGGCVGWYVMESVFCLR